jgi:hypothetical protein
VGRLQPNGESRRMVVPLIPILLIDPAECMLEQIRMRDSQRGVGNLTRAGQPLQLGGIGYGKAPEHESRRMQGWPGRHAASMGVLLCLLNPIAQLSRGVLQCVQLGVPTAH